MGALSAAVRKCVVCGKLYHPTQWKQKTCSVGCRAIHEMYVKKVPEKGACLYCGKAFESIHERKFCNDICRAKWHDSKVWTEFVCAECGKTFMRSTRRKIYCGRACNAAAKARRRREQTGS